eukprot:CAMPEP_0172592580 /NCGR_PEP_ID=MMETSP1068-20121228/11590_1 /TAXON_ID=35684 /ORGANISM="Pseudopedinella elastica, Strain CCMP716" /LENGTH=549 /DNA_ID=CAMNT_0013389641 /DNA_START=47 /DNA_END=1696 /DNA_ORIENTATION=-
MATSSNIIRAVLLILAANQAVGFSPRILRSVTPVAHGRSAETARESVIAASSILDQLAKDGEGDAEIEKEYDEALGILVFGSNDPTLEIARNMDFYDEKFQSWLTNKAEASTDLEEREAFKSLAEMVGEIRDKYFENEALEVREGVEDAEVVEEAQDEEEDPFAGIPRATFDESGNAVTADEPNSGSKASSSGDVFSGMRDIQFGGGFTDAAAADAAREQEERTKQAQAAELEVRTSYIKALAALLPLGSAELAKAVKENYLQFDFKFLQVCGEVRLSDPDQSEAIDRVVAAVNAEATARVQASTEILQQVLSMGSPGLMETEITKQVKEGRVDEGVLNLLEANIEAATKAGAAPAAQLMAKLKERAQLELDKLKPADQRLMAQLIRTSSSEERKKLLEAAFEPKQSVLLTMEDSDEAPPEPEVPPPQFIELAKAMIQNFGNLQMPGSDEAGLRDKLLEIASEAEQVSVAIYGESMTAKDQQDRMWNDGTVSIWDLEQMEQEAEINGEQMPWHGDVDENMFIEKFQKGKWSSKEDQGFDDKGVKRVGGN